MQKPHHAILFLGGIGIGLAASILLTPEAGAKTRRRIQNVSNRVGEILGSRAEHAADAGGEILDEYNLTRQERRKALGDLKDKAKDTIDDAADAAKRTVEEAIDRTEDAVHVVGEKIEDGGQHLQGA